MKTYVNPEYTTTFTLVTIVNMDKLFRHKFDLKIQTGSKVLMAYIVNKIESEGGVLKKKISFLGWNYARFCLKNIKIPEYELKKKTRTTTN